MAHDIPDVLGLRLSEAEKILNDAGLDHLIEHISSYSRDKVDDGFPRVIRQVADSGELIKLTIANVRDVFFNDPLGL